ncbi:MAG: IS1182 family transposase, partial [Nanoarchaeota archaeon]|nr:IS1182 family transposase [Nanoarchaeota archaeon]
NFDDFDQKVNGPGNPSYHPRVIIKIILNGICERITSTRKLEKQTMENIVFRYLSENLNPDFHTIAMFRKENRDLIKKCFLQTVEIAKKLDMVNLNKLYLDGIKVKANASKSKTFTKEEIDFLSEFVDKQFEEAENVDKEEDKKYGESNGEIKIPEHLTHRRKLQEKVKGMLKDIGKAKVQMDKAKAKIQQEKVEGVNMTDMDSRVMKMKKGFYEQSYNCQLLVEDKCEIIVGNYITNSPTDIHETRPTMEKFKEEQKASLKGVEVFQDNGYMGSDTAEYYKEEEAIAYIPDRVTTKELHGKSKKISKFDNDRFELDFEKNQAICPEGHRMNFVRRETNKNGNWTNIYRTDKCRDCKFQKECTDKGKHSPFRTTRINPLIREIRLRFKTKEGIEKYNKRFHKGEVAQAHIFHNLSYREFKCRDKKPCENEMNLFSTAYNMIKIYKKWKENGGMLEVSVKKYFLLMIYHFFNKNYNTASHRKFI